MEASFSWRLTRIEENILVIVERSVAYSGYKLYLQPKRAVSQLQQPGDTAPVQ